MPFSRVVGLAMPVGFDVASYDEVNDRVALIANPNDAAAPWKRNAWFGYAAAWNGLAYRLRSAIEYDEEFGRLISLGTAPPRDEHYAQERALFGCVAAALSAIECLYIGTYCVGSALSPRAFPLLNAVHLNRNPIEVAQKYLAWIPSDTFSQQLVKVANSSELTSLADLRNALAHRGVLPRQHFLSNVGTVPSAVPSNPKALAENFVYDGTLSHATTSVPTAWLRQTTSQVVNAFRDFLVRTC